MDSDLPAADLGIAQIVEEYRVTGNIGTLFDRIRSVVAGTDPEQLTRAVRPYMEMPEVVIPAYEYVVSQRPQDAQAMVVLANAYWLTGRGAEVVGQLAVRAKAADPRNRGAWHLWALAESDIRARVGRWSEVTRAFPDDQLARAALADNAISLSSAEDDPAALDVAIRTYESLLAEAAHPAQRSALEATLAALRKR